MAPFSSVRDLNENVKSMKYILGFFTLLICIQSLAYDSQVSGVQVGLIRTYGNLGLSAFTRADGQAFPGCTKQPTHMWVDSSFVTADGGKSIMSILLSAKATKTPVTVYYVTADGYCRFHIVDLE